MYLIANTLSFVDVDIDFESEWNPHYTDSYLEEPQSPLSLPQVSASGLMYECSFCLQPHAPSMPCNSNYVFLLPSLASSYTYESPFRNEKLADDGIVESNYRKWLVSVTPR